MKKKRFYIFLLILMTAFASGCGSGQESQPSAEETEEVSEAESPEESEEEETTEDAGSENTEDEKADGASSEEADEKSESAVASADEMTDIEDVTEDWMVPIYGDSLNDGTYPAAVSSSSSMFRIDSAELTVADGEMTVVMTMGGKGYRYLYMGTGEEAVSAEESEYIQHQEDADGAHTFTIPVEALDEGFSCTAFSDKKEKWYDRTLLVRSDSLPLEAFKEGSIVTAQSLNLEDGEYSVDVSLSGGSGKATVDSPTKLKVSGGECIATIVWSSPNYDYMIVDGEKYLPVNEEGNSTYEIPVKAFDRNLAIIADTVAMSEPHEISYTLFFDSNSIGN